MPDQKQHPRRQRQVDAIDGTAGIPLEKHPAETSDPAPTSEDVAKRTRQLRDQLTDDQRLITGIRTGFGMLPVT